MSETNTPLPKAIASLLKCVRCKQYLSVPPITFNQGGYQCGRCDFNKENPNALAATAYENLAKITQFPCMYDSEGCSKQLNFHDTRTHEMRCTFRKIRCPAKQCAENVQLCRLLSHFETTHPQLVIPSGDIQFDTNCVENKLVSLDGKLYVLELFICSEMRNFWVSLQFLEPDSCISYNLAVESANGNQLVLQQRRMREFSKLYPPYGQSEKISSSFESLRAALQCNTFTFKIKTETPVSATPRADHKVLEELECGICNEYMVPPIYICTTGHSICYNCRHKIEVCPTCKAKYEGTRNFVLERLSEHIYYPCKNQSNGCSYSGSSLTIRYHESNCSKQIINCPIRFPKCCGWRGMYQDTYSHIKDEHPQKCQFELNHPVCFKLAVKIDQQVLHFNEQIFIVRMRFCSTNKTVAWNVEQVETEGLKYQFILNFIDCNTKTSRTLSLNGNCCRSESIFGNKNVYSNSRDIWQLLCCNKINMEKQLRLMRLHYGIVFNNWNSVTLPYNVLKPFVTEGLLHFMIDIQLIPGQTNSN